MAKPTRVVAGIVKNAAGKILIAQRPPDKPMPGRWEFPGGKIQSGEAAQTALARELLEELGIRVVRTSPLIRLHHDYPALSVALDIHCVERYEGSPRPLENQTLAWVAADALGERDLLEADRPIVSALQLPDRCWVTPPPKTSVDDWLRTVQDTIRAGMPMLQCRIPQAADVDRLALGRAIRAASRERQTLFIWNGTAAEAAALDAHGVHLGAASLRQCAHRPTAVRWVGASCHTESEVRHASRLGLDYVFVGSIRPTASHPGGAVLGLDGFARLVQSANVPAYAIGGMTPDDIPRVRRAGGQGIAAIRSLARTGGRS